MNVMYFGADGCPQCRAMISLVQEWCETNKIEFTQWDADSDDAATLRQLCLYNIKSIPSVVVKLEFEVKVIRGIGEWNKFVEDSK